MDRCSDSAPSFFKAKTSGATFWAGMELLLLVLGCGVSFFEFSAPSGSRKRVGVEDLPCRFLQIEPARREQLPGSMAPWTRPVPREIDFCLGSGESVWSTARIVGPRWGSCGFNRLPEVCKTRRVCRIRAAFFLVNRIRIGIFTPPSARLGRPGRPLCVLG